MNDDVKNTVVEPAEVVGLIQQETDASPVTINYYNRSVDMYHVQDSELDSIGSANTESSLYMGFCGITIGLALALVGILSQVEITSAKVFAACWAILVVSSVASILLGIKAVLSHFHCRSQVDRIRQQSKPK